MTKQDRKQQPEYTHSPWSGKAYQKPPTVADLTEESQGVLGRHPAISKAMRLESMDKFIAAYKAQHGIK